MTVLVPSQTTNKLEAANDSAWVNQQARSYNIPPALGTNQIAGFGGFRPLASLEKKYTLFDGLAYNTCDFRSIFPSRDEKKYEQ